MREEVGEGEREEREGKRERERQREREREWREIYRMITSPTEAYVRIPARPQQVLFIVCGLYYLEHQKLLLFQFDLQIVYILLVNFFSRLMSCLTY